MPIRKYSSGQLYKRLFATAGLGTESPLIYHTRRFSQSAQEHLGPQFVVEFGMRYVLHQCTHINTHTHTHTDTNTHTRTHTHTHTHTTKTNTHTRIHAWFRYGEPSMARALEALKRRGCERVIVLPDYPQYSGTTTASIYDEIFATAAQYRFVPTLRIVPPFYAHPAYIRALVHTASAFLEAHSGIEKYIVSFHGIPERYHLRGDPYPWHCEATARALAQGMNWAEDEWLLSYQSVFGKDPWLLPATDETVERLGKQGGLEHGCVFGCVGVFGCSTSRPLFLCLTRSRSTTLQA